MRKINIISIILAVVIILSLFNGCSDKEVEETPTHTTEPTPTIEPIEVEKGEIKGFNDRSYLLYVPESFDQRKGMNLIIMLHGGSQTAETFRDETGMNVTADKYGFLVLYISQAPSQNMSLYWNWFNEANQKRDMGDGVKIIGCLNEIKERYKVNDVFVAGLSAGACQAVNMAACYPDVVKGIAVVAGVSFMAASSPTNALMVMGSGVTASMVNNNAAIAVKNINEYNINTIKTIVIHGNSDEIVSKINGEQVVSQFININDNIDNGKRDFSVALESEKIETYFDKNVEITKYKNANNEIVVESVYCDNIHHTWSGEGKGGEFVNNETINYNEEIVAFFGLK